MNKWVLGFPTRLRIITKVWLSCGLLPQASLLNKGVRGCSTPEHVVGRGTIFETVSFTWLLRSSVLSPGRPSPYHDFVSLRWKEILWWISVHLPPPFWFIHMLPPCRWRIRAYREHIFPAGLFHWSVQTVRLDLQMARGSPLDMR